MSNHDFNQLRKRAEAMLAVATESSKALTTEEIRTLVHDLSVHQIELELQNEELLHAQQQIEKTRDELARLYHQAPVGYLTLNRSGAIERCNQTFATMTGRSTDTLLNKPLADLLEGADREIFLGRFRSFYNQPADKSIDLYFPSQGVSNGFHGRLTASIRVDAAHYTDSAPRLLVIVQDVTEQRIESLIRMKTEMKLKSHDAFISTLLETMPIPIFYKDTKCRYLGCNRAFKEFVGLEDSQLIGKTVFDIAPADIALRYEELDQHLLANPGTQSYEWKVSTQNGSVRTVVFNKATYTDADGQLAGIVGTMQDITDLKDLQICMQEARESAEQSNRAKSEFLANMSHELRTPMNGVLGMAQLLEMSPLTPEQNDYVSAIMQSGLNLVKIIGDILDLSKIEARKIELEHRVFSLKEVINQTINLLRPQSQSKGLTIFCRIEPDLQDLFWGDPGRLHQILLNLLGNSIKFTSSGSISITVLSGPPEGDKTSLRFSITDTGIGIPRASLHKLFIPFSQVDGSTTRKFGGTGLGLAISKQLVELMGGTISVESTEGSGSTFFIRLPLEPASETDCEPCMVAEPSEKTDHLPQNYRILVAEDDKLNQKVIEIMLGKLGYQTGMATNGEESLTLLKAEKFDLVLMDCSMPGVDGYKATALIRDAATGVLNPHIPVIALTARVMQGDREKCLKAGMNDYLSKPIHYDELKNVIYRWLTEKES